MSFEDTEVARAACAAKEVIKGKGKRGRRRKSAALEADELEAAATAERAEAAEATEIEAELEPEVAHAATEVIKDKGKRGQKRKSTAQQPDEPEPEMALMVDALVQ